MNRRGFLFGAGAALAVIPAARLMPVRVPKLLIWRHQPDLLLIDDDPAMWTKKSAVEIMADIDRMFGALAALPKHINCRCEINPIIIRSRLYEGGPLDGADQLN